MVFFRPYLEQLSSLQPLGDDLVAHVGLKHLTWSSSPLFSPWETTSWLM
jgi:hypothetical protein